MTGSSRQRVRWGERGEIEEGQREKEKEGGEGERERRYKRVRMYTKL